MSRRKTLEGRRPSCSIWRLRLGLTVLLLVAVSTKFLWMYAYFALVPLDSDVRAQWGDDRFCLHSSNPSPLVDRKEASTRVVPFSEFLEGGGMVKNTSTEAICEFRPVMTYDLRFPHTMQQLYRCISWWRAHPNKTSILLNPPEKYHSSFTNGMLHMLKDLFNVKFVHEGWPRLLQVYLSVGKANENAVYMNRVEVKKRPYEMRSPADFEFIREQLAASDKGQSNHAGCPSHGISLPKVTILNRELKSGRHILDAGVLKDMIHEKLGLTVNVIPSMDGQNFLQQLHLMQDTDILLSPHGAQLTSLPFIPSCGHVMEFFPVGLLDVFYESLATSTGHSYSYVYTGYNFSSEDLTKSYHNRRKARSRQICVHEEAIRNQIIPALRREVNEWQRCCTLLQRVSQG